MRARRATERAFSFARGVRLAGTSLCCDGPGSASDLVFLSHAQAVGALGARRFPLRRGGRQEVLATAGTLALLGRAGERLRRRALPAELGRPFSLGESRLELFSSGHLPGAASLLVEAGERRLVYAGSVRAGRPGFGAPPAEVRRADALCIDGTLGDPRFVLPPPEEALAAVRRFVVDCRAEGRAPVLLVPPFGTAMDVAATLAEAGVGLRAHRAIVSAAAAFRAAGARPPLMARFAGRLGDGEALLWPSDAREAPLLGALGSPRFALVSAFSLDPPTLRRLRADVGIGLSNLAGFPDLLAYVEASGAREVAVHRGFTEALAAILRQRGIEAYALGPPHQMDLFAG
jgi:putative mRNA 3-end processing factor